MSRTSHPLTHPTASTWAQPPSFLACVSITALDWSLRLPLPLYNLFSKQQPGAPFETKPKHMTFLLQSPHRLPFLFRIKAMGLAVVWEAHVTQICCPDLAQAPPSHSFHLPSCPVASDTPGSSAQGSVLPGLYPHCSLPRPFPTLVQRLRVTISPRPPLATVVHIQHPLPFCNSHSSASSLYFPPFFLAPFRVPYNCVN